MGDTFASPDEHDTDHRVSLGASGREPAGTDSLARRRLSQHRGVSKDELTPYFRAFQPRRKVVRKPGEEALNTILETAL